MAAARRPSQTGRVRSRQTVDRDEQLRRFVERLDDVGDGDALLTWVGAQGLDAQLVCLTANCAAAATAPTVAYGPAAFLTGFLAALCRSEGVTRRVADTSELLARATRTVALRGRHALIAEHCDLGDVARLEDEVGEELATRERESGQLTRLVCLFESGLAVGLAATAACT